MRKGLTNLFGATRKDKKDKHSEMEVPLIYPAQDPDENVGDIIINATALDLHPDAEAGAKNPASTLSKLTSSLVAASSSLTKTKQPEEEPPLEAEAGAQNTATSFANTRSSISTLTSSIKKVAVAAALSLTKTKQPEEEPPSEEYRPGSTIATQNQELAFDLACRTGDIENFNKIIDQNPDIIKIKCNGNFPLITALKNKHSEIATALIEKGANPDPKNNGAPLQIACKNGDEKAVKALIGKEVNLDIGRESGKNGICIACINNHPEIVRQLIDAGADLNAGLPGNNILHIACGLGHYKVAKVLIEKRPELLNQADAREETPLHLATKYGHPETVEQLINAGIHLNEEALLYGLSNEFADLFIAKVDLNQSTKDGKTLLCIACEDQDDYLVELLIQKGARIDQVAKDGRAPIDIACQNYNTEIVQMLFDAGANVDPEIKKQIQSDQQKTNSTADERIEMIKLIDTITTPESIQRRDKELTNKRQPSSDVTLAGAGLALNQEAGKEGGRDNNRG